jgi:hypothetical protein
LTATVNGLQRMPNERIGAGNARQNEERGTRKAIDDVLVKRQRRQPVGQEERV